MVRVSPGWRLGGGAGGRLWNRPLHQRTHRAPGRALLHGRGHRGRRWWREWWERCRSLVWDCSRAARWILLAFRNAAHGKTHIQKCCSFTCVYYTLAKGPFKFLLWGTIEVKASSEWWCSKKQDFDWLTGFLSKVWICSLQKALNTSWFVC